MIYFWRMICPFSGTIRTNSKSSKIQVHGVFLLGLVAPQHAVGDCGSIVTAVRFSHNKERVAGIFRIGLEKGLQKVIRIFADHLLVAIRLLTVRKANTCRLIQPENVRSFGPRVRIDRGRGAVSVDRTGSVFGQKGKCLWIKISKVDSFMKAVRK